MLNIKTKLRRAFTIVELVVVIAVIAALAAILIPTFANVIKSANESADMQLVKNLNTILATDEAINGAPSTMDDVLAVTSENGYNIDKLTPSSSGDIVWDKNTNRFVLINEGGEVIYYDDSYDAEEAVLWYITDSTTILTDKNYYYANAVTTDNGSLTLTSGADLSNTEVESVTINASNTQISVTVNNAAVTVSSDSNSTVNLYGTISTVEGTYGTNSLHIYGTVTGKIVLSSGRVVAEKGSYIESIIITAETLSADIKIEAESSSSINSIGATESTVAAGISSISKGVSSSAIVSTAVSNDFAGGAGTEASPYQIATATEFLKIGNHYVEMATNHLYFILVNDIDLSEQTFTTTYAVGYFRGTFDGDGYTITTNDSLKYLFLYTFDGTVYKDLNVQWDYSITKVSYMQALVVSQETTSGSYNVTESYDEDWITYENVDYKGQAGVSYIMSSDNEALYLDSTYCVALPISIASSSINVLNNWVYQCYYYNSNSSTETITANAVINKCDVSADITSTSNRTAIFTGGQLYWMNVSITNSSYDGYYIGNNVALLYANGSGYDNGNWGTMVAKNNTIYGNIVALSSGGNAWFANVSYTLLSGDTIEKVNSDSRFSVLQSTNMTITVNGSGEVVITEPTSVDVYYYLVDVCFSAIYSYDSEGNKMSEYSTPYISIKVYADDLADFSLSSCVATSYNQISDKLTISSWNLSENGYYYAFTTYSETNYLVIKLADNKGIPNETNCTFRITAYSEDNIPVAYAKQS